MSEINTTAGSVSAADLGPTLMHEHVFANLMQEYRATGLLNGMDTMVEEVESFVAVGGGTIVDVTPAELTRGASPDPGGALSATGAQRGGWPSRSPENVAALEEVASRTGAHIIVGTGHYRDPYLGDGWLDEHTVGQISEQLIHDVEEGISGTGVRAGIIGEIGADKWFVSAREERSFRAAARAQCHTGLALTTHAARWPVGIAQLDLLAEEGVDPRRVIIGHCDSVPLIEYHEAIARRGAFVQYDLIRGESEAQTRRTVELVVQMVRKGFGSHLLLSHDVCTSAQLASNGGSGFTFVPTVFAAALHDAGLEREEVDSILRDNPRRALVQS